MEQQFPTPQELFDLARRAVADAKYSFEEHPEGTYLVGPFAGNAVGYDITILCGVGYITLVAQLPLVVAPEKFVEALAHLNRLNAQLPVGAYVVYEGVSKVQFKIGLATREIPSPSSVVTALWIASAQVEKIVPIALSWVPKGVT